MVFLILKTSKRLEMDIVHIINRDKFTSGYINFMKMQMSQFKHHFFLLNQGFDLKLFDEKNIYYITDYLELIENIENVTLCTEADKIIISGFFNMSKAISKFSQNVLNKTYIHLWGGDFYYLAEKQNFMHFRKKYHNKRQVECLKKCAGVIFLIDGEYEKFKSITGMEKKSFTAPMPEDPFNVVDYVKYRNDEINNRILIGNSATKSNNHVEIFQKIVKFVDAVPDLEVICPLSYGDERYCNMVIKKGIEIFGDKFKYITEYMDEEQYVKLLSECSIGIFNNNRQQAMGNINTMLLLGKKVFLRTDTSMWNIYRERGYKIYSVEDISKMTEKEFFAVDILENNVNCEAAKRYIENKETASIEMWNQVFEYNLLTNE